MKTSRASAAMWDRANRRNNAQSGLGDPADATHKVMTIKALIASIGKNPAALELLAARQHEMTPEQRMAALKAFSAAAPKAKAKPKAAPKVKPPAPSRLSRTLAGVGLYGKSGTGAPS